MIELRAQQTPIEDRLIELASQAESRNNTLRADHSESRDDGEIVREFFDIGLSRSLPWKRRPEATALLAALADPERGFDAVVIGEPQRAFYGNQFGLTFPVFVHYGVGLWVPEVGGAIDPGSDAHDLVMSLYGGMSKGERNRIRIRVRSSMHALTKTQGRFLGGRPPYGYRLTDAGPHPNPGKAADGARQHKLEPDPVAAPVVVRIFESYVSGKGLGAIADELTRDGIASPSGHDPKRNPHRAWSNGAWGRTAVRSILRNPRYTGRSVWGKQRRDEVLLDVENPGDGYEAKMRWNAPEAWVWSDDITHEPIISPELFARAAASGAAGAARRASHEKVSRTRNFALRGLLRCSLCGRLMVGQQSRERMLYRCRVGDNYSLNGRLKHPRNVYVREDEIVPVLDTWLGGVLDTRPTSTTRSRRSKPIKPSRGSRLTVAHKPRAFGLPTAINA